MSKNNLRENQNWKDCWIEYEVKEGEFAQVEGHLLFNINGIKGVFNNGTTTSARYGKAPLYLYRGKNYSEDSNISEVVESLKKYFMENSFIHKGICSMENKSIDLNNEKKLYLPFDIMNFDKINCLNIKNINVTNEDFESICSSFKNLNFAFMSNCKIDGNVMLSKIKNNPVIMLYDVIMNSTKQLNHLNTSHLVFNGVSFNEVENTSFTCKDLDISGTNFDMFKFLLMSKINGLKEFKVNREETLDDRDLMLFSSLSNLESVETNAIIKNINTLYKLPMLKNIDKLKLKHNIIYSIKGKYNSFFEKYKEIFNSSDRIESYLSDKYVDEYFRLINDNYEILCMDKKYDMLRKSILNDDEKEAKNIVKQYNAIEINTRIKNGSLSNKEIKKLYKSEYFTELDPIKKALSPKKEKNLVSKLVTKDSGIINSSGINIPSQISRKYFCDEKGDPLLEIKGNKVKNLSMEIPF